MLAGVWFAYSVPFTGWLVSLNAFFRFFSMAVFIYTIVIGICRCRFGRSDSASVLFGDASQVMTLIRITS